LTNITKHVKQAVVVITTYDKSEKPLLQGSGFFVETKYLITTLHLIKDAYRAQIRTFNGRTYPVEGIAALNEQRDLALLEIGGASKGWTTLAVEETMPTEGEEIIVVSNPQGASWTVSTGVIEAIWNFQGIGDLMRITAAISPGSSGGPVVNRRGRVVGIAAMHIDSADDLNFAVPSELIKALRPGPLRPLPGHIVQVTNH
jgi:S1-C subfamily serine protease